MKHMRCASRAILRRVWYATVRVCVVIIWMCVTCVAPSATAFTLDRHNDYTVLQQNSHVYERMYLHAGNNEVVRYSDLSLFARSLTYTSDGTTLFGHIVTVNECYELIPGNGRLVGALKQDGAWLWSEGPEAGSVITFCGEVLDNYGAAQCRNIQTRAWMTSTTSVFYATPDTWLGPELCYNHCGCTGCCLDGQDIFVEYEIDTVTPTLVLTSPNGGEHIQTGEATIVRFDLRDAFGLLDDATTVELSRTGRLGPYEVLVDSLSDTDSTEVLIGGPPTDEGTAYLRIAAVDCAGNAVADTSDGGFTISPGPSSVDVEDLVDDKVAVSPNPSGRRIALVLASEQTGECEIDIVNVQGKRVAHFTNIRLAKGPNRLYVDLSESSDEMDRGAYFLRITSGWRTWSRRIVLNR